MNAALNKIYADGVKYAQAQEICRNVLLQRISGYYFRNAEIKCAVNELVKNMAFPLEYSVEVEQLSVPRKENRRIALGLVVAGIIFLVISLSFGSLVAGLLIGLSFYFFKTSSQTEIREKIRIVTPKEALARYIDKAFEQLVGLDRTLCETRTIHNELLRWFQQLYSTACRVPGNDAFKEDIMNIMLRFGYEFCEYSPECADFFDATNARIENVTTTVYAMRKTEDNDIVLRGKVVFPIN